MGQHASAALLFGYNLGSAENGWLIKEITEEGDWDVDPSSDEHTSQEGHGLLENALLTKVIGFTEPDPFPGAYQKHGIDSPEYQQHYGWHKRRRQALDDFPLQVTLFGYERNELALVAREVEADYEPTAVDLAGLEQQRKTFAWDKLLQDAVTAIGITPVVTEDNNRWDYNAPRVPVPPRWMMVATYS